MNDDGALWTINDLGKKVVQALRSAGHDGVPSGRVRDVPDERTIRYYTTLGLIDRPAAMRGRTALYRLRHLLQLVAIKRLQALGLSLAEVQRRVLGLSDSALEQLIGSKAAAGRVAATAASAPRSESFWRVVENDEHDQAKAEGISVQTIRLGDGLKLALPAERQLDEDDLRVIRMAAAPMIELLKLRGLIRIGP
jgi:DNA-binding transcriptional MerR regulator